MRDFLRVISALKMLAVGAGLVQYTVFKFRGNLFAGRSGWFIAWMKTEK